MYQSVKNIAHRFFGGRTSILKNIRSGLTQYAVKQPRSGKKAGNHIAGAIKKGISQIHVHDKDPK